MSFNKGEGRLMEVVVVVVGHKLGVMLHSYPPPMGWVGCQQGPAPADKPALWLSSTLASLPVCPAPISAPHPAFQLLGFGTMGIAFLGDT